MDKPSSYRETSMTKTGFEIDSYAFEVNRLEFLLAAIVYLRSCRLENTVILRLRYYTSCAESKGRRTAVYLLQMQPFLVPV